MNEIIEVLRVISHIAWIVFVTAYIIGNALSIKKLWKEHDKGIERNARDIEIIVDQMQKNAKNG